MQRAIVESEIIFLSGWNQQFFEVAVITIVIALGNIDRYRFGQAFQWFEELRPPLVIMVAVSYKVTRVDNEIDVLFCYLFNYFTMSFGVSATVTINDESYFVSVGRNCAKTVEITFAFRVNNAVEIRPARLQILKPGFMNENG
ncbi:unnamed protein product, partial [marine sediment metagenome]